VEENLPFFLQDGDLISDICDGYCCDKTYLKRETWTDRKAKEEEWPLDSNSSKDTPKMYIYNSTRTAEERASL
jgi:hypothetical protein